MSWHLDQKVTIGVIFAIAINSGSLIWGAAELAASVKQLGTIPERMSSLENRVLTVELKDEILIGVIGEFKYVLQEVKDTLNRIDREQARRTPMVDRVEGQMTRPNNGKK